MIWKIGIILAISYILVQIARVIAKDGNRND